MAGSTAARGADAEKDKGQPMTTTDQNLAAIRHEKAMTRYPVGTPAPVRMAGYHYSLHLRRDVPLAILGLALLVACVWGLLR